MTDTTWFLIGIAAGVAGTAAVMLARAVRNAFRIAAHDLAARIDAVLDAQPEPDEHIEDDVWDRDLRNLLTDSID